MIEIAAVGIMGAVVGAVLGSMLRRNVRRWWSSWAVLVISSMSGLSFLVVMNTGHRLIAIFVIGVASGWLVVGWLAVITLLMRRDFNRGN